MSEKKPRAAVRKSLAALYTGDGQSDGDGSVKPDLDEPRLRASAGGMPGMVLGQAQQRLQDRVDELETELASRREQPTIRHLDPSTLR